MFGKPEKLTKSKKKLENLSEVFGIEIQKETSNHVIINCPFCGHENSLFINSEELLWDCKVCGKKGRWEHFLTYIHKLYVSLTPDTALAKLANHRALPIEAFNNYNIAYTKGQYWLPIYNHANKVMNLKRFKLDSKLIGLKATENGIFNYQILLHTKRSAVYICEGEFDCIALNWLLKINKKPGIVIAIPGANNFKSNWVNYFLDRLVIMCLDHDGAGISGKRAIYNKLEALAQSITHVDWPEEYPPKYDINDFITAYAVKSGNPKEGMGLLEKIIVDYKKETEEYEEYEEVTYITKSTNRSDVVESSSDLLCIDSLIHCYGDVFELNDDFIIGIKICLATILSIRLPGGDPLWLFLVGPPGYGKTAILSSMKEAKKQCYFQSSLRRHSLVSGYRAVNGTDPSLIPKLDQKCLVLKDYTEILSKSGPDRDEIFGILRGAFDGYVERDFGNDIVRRYNVMFSMLAGVTNIIKSHSQATLGERFLRFCITTVGIDHDAQQKAAMKNAIIGSDKRIILQKQVKKFLNRKWDFSPATIQKMIPKWFIEKVIPLSRLLGHLRTQVARKERGLGRDTPAFRPEPESGNRIGIQLQRLAISLAIIEEKPEIDGEIYNIIKRVAVDTVRHYTTDIIELLVRISGEALTLKQISEAIDVPYSSICTIREDLQLIKLIERGDNIAVGSNNKIVHTFRITKHINDLWKKAEL